MSNTEIIKTDDVLVRIMELEKDASTEWHYHTRVTDHFTCLAGTVRVETKNPNIVTELYLFERYEVQPSQVHRVVNISTGTSKYLLAQGVGKYDFIREDATNNSNNSMLNISIPLNDIQNISSRDKEIFKLHIDGMSNSLISKMFDISADRVNQICKKLTEYNQHYPPLKNLLSVRSQKLLIKHFNDKQILEHPDTIIKNMSPTTLLRIKGIGRIFYSEITDALIYLGYLRLGDKWFKR
jgi:quercetin dioxygenase-like cupin family protein